MNTPAEPTAIERMCANAVDAKFESLDPVAVEDAKYRIIDTLGCLIGGAQDTGNRELVRLQHLKGGRKEATILFYGVRVPAGEAAFTNCAMSRSFDFEPVSPLVEDFTCPGHTSGTTVPTALAAAEAVNASGKEFLTALLAGDDIAARLLAASGFGFSLGWDGTGTVNTFASTGIAGRLFRLDKMQLRHAMGIALNQVGSTFQIIWDGTMAFKLPQGLSGRAGILSAQLAKAGFTGPEDALMSKAGYYKMFTDGCKNPAVLTANLGSKFYYDGTIKPYPCCRIVHAAIDAALALKRKYNIITEDIETVNLELAQAGIDHQVGQPFRIGLFPHANAAFSYEYVVSTAFLFGSVKPEHMTEPAIRNPHIPEFIKKIRLVPAADVAFEKARMTVVLKDGRELTENVVDVKGDPRTNPMTHEDIIAKFQANAAFSGRFPPRKVEFLLHALQNLEKLDSVRRLVPLLVAK